MVFVRVTYPFELEFGNVVYYGGRKTGEHGEKPSELGERLSPHMALGWHWAGTGLESNLGNIGGRRALSPLRHPNSPSVV